MSYGFFRNMERDCYSRKFHRESDFRLEYDEIRLNLSKIVDLKLIIQIYIHQEGQIIRHIRNSETAYVSVFHWRNLKSLILKNNSRTVVYKIDDVVMS